VKSAGAKDNAAGDVFDVGAISGVVE